MYISLCKGWIRCHLLIKLFCRRSVPDIWHKYHSWYFNIVSNFTLLTAREIKYKNFEISLVVFMPNITTNHAITYTNWTTLSPFTLNQNCFEKVCNGWVNTGLLNNSWPLTLLCLQNTVYLLLWLQLMSIPQGILETRLIGLNSFLLPSRVGVATN